MDHFQATTDCCQVSPDSVPSGRFWVRDHLCLELGIPSGFITALLCLSLLALVLACRGDPPMKCLVMLVPLRPSRPWWPCEWCALEPPCGTQCSVGVLSLMSVIGSCIPTSAFLAPSLSRGCPSTSTLLSVAHHFPQASKSTPPTPSSKFAHNLGSLPGEPKKSVLLSEPLHSPFHIPVPLTKHPHPPTSCLLPVQWMGSFCS